MRFRLINRAVLSSAEVVSAFQLSAQKIPVTTTWCARREQSASGSKKRRKMRSRDCMRFANGWKFGHLQRVRRAGCRRKSSLQKQKGESARKNQLRNVVHRRKEKKGAEKKDRERIRNIYRRRSTLRNSAVKDKSMPRTKTQYRGIIIPIFFPFALNSISKQGRPQGDKGDKRDIRPPGISKKLNICSSFE